MRYRFDDFEVDAEAFVLLRGGAELPIPPLALQLLLVLLEQHGRVVTREELFRRLWEDRVVGDAALATCLSSLRKTLGDDAKNPRYVVTRHGVGLCFAAPVVARGEAEPAGPLSLPEQTAWNRRPWLPAILGTTVLGVLGWLVVRPDVLVPDLPAARAVAPTVLLAPLAVGAEDPDAELLGVALIEASARALEHGGWIVLGPLAAEDIADADNVSELLETVGADLALTGGVSRSAAHQPLQLTFEPHWADSARSEGGRRLMAPTLDADRSLDALAVAVGQVLAAVESGRPPVPVPVAVARDLTAYRLYLRGLRWLEEPGCDAGALTELLDQSLGLDPDFAPTWVLQARLHRHLATGCVFGRQHLVAALERAQRGIGLDPEAVAPRVLSAALHYELGDAPAARTAFDTLRARHPSHPAVACLGLRLSAASGQRLVDTDIANCGRGRGLAGSVGGELPLAVMFGGGYQAFLDLGPYDRSLRGRYLRAFAAFRLGREPESRAGLEPLFELGPAEVWGRLAHALLALIEGRSADATEIVTAVIAVRQAAELGDLEVDYHLGQLLVLAGELELAAKQFESVRDRGFACDWCAVEDPVLERLRVAAPAMAKD